MKTKNNQKKISDLKRNNNSRPLILVGMQNQRQNKKDYDENDSTEYQDRNETTGSRRNSRNEDIYNENGRGMEMRRGNGRYDNENERYDYSNNQNNYNDRNYDSGRSRFGREELERNGRNSGTDYSSRREGVRNRRRGSDEYFEYPGYENRSGNRAGSSDYSGRSSYGEERSRRPYNEEYDRRYEGSHDDFSGRGGRSGENYNDGQDMYSRSGNRGRNSELNRSFDERSSGSTQRGRRNGNSTEGSGRGSTSRTSGRRNASDTDSSSRTTSGSLKAKTNSNTTGAKRGRKPGSTSSRKSSVKRQK